MSLPTFFMAKTHSEVYDAYYDDKEDIWLEKGCGKENCIYCANRPEKPSMAKEL